MKTAIITISEAGAQTAGIIKAETGGTLIQRAAVADSWAAFDAFVFIGALGICVRTVAPLISDKHSDPAVLCVDTFGAKVIPVLSGHVGGANSLAEIIASALGAEPVITTQSDNSGLWALDTLAGRFGWTVAGGSCPMNDAVFAFVGRQPTALFMDVCDAGTDYIECTLPAHVSVVESIDEVDSAKYRLCIIISPRRHRAPQGMLVLYYVPRVLTVGIGLARQAQPVAGIISAVGAVLSDLGFLPAVESYCTIDVKADEPVVKALQQAGAKVRFFTAGELASVEVPNPSSVVARHVGTPSVCEAAAILGSGHGRLLAGKQKGGNFTVALAIGNRYQRPQQGQGHIEIVGAGPGDPDLISVRGRRFLEEADLILYAGSLVPRELTRCAKPGAVVRSSASMSLGEQCRLMSHYYAQGKQIVRLHTGDPCIFGAIQEQMAFFDEQGMHYHITPGISSFLAAAAELRSQFTIPGRCQTIILTRGEGRTPMPEREQLHLLAKSRSTMCIFLSAAIADDVQAQLLQEYPEDTPVAACYHLTWSDQRIYRGRLKDLARIVRENGLTLTTMLVVGEAIDNRRGLSELYNEQFTHLFRKGTQQE